MVAKLFEQSECIEITAVPGRSEYRVKVLFHMSFKPVPASNKIFPDTGGGPTRSKFLLFPFHLVIYVSPAMLVPAPEGWGLMGKSFKPLPSRSGEPCWNHCQGKGHAVSGKEFHKTGEPFSGNCHVIGTEKDVSGASCTGQVACLVNTAPNS